MRTPRVPRPARHSVERALLEAESLVRDFSEDNRARWSPCSALPTSSARI